MNLFGELKNVLIEINFLLEIINLYLGENTYTERLTKEVEKFEKLWSYKDKPGVFKDSFAFSLFMEQYYISLDLCAKARLEIKQKMVGLIKAIPIHSN